MQPLLDVLRVSETAQLFAGVCAILVVASAIGYGLKLRVAKGQAHATIDNLNARINAWWVMVAVLGIAFLFGKMGTIVMFALISVLALREYLRAANANKEDSRLVVIIAYAFVVPLQYGLVWTSWYGLYSILIPVYGFLLLPIVAVLVSGSHDFLQRAAKVQWGVMACVFCVSHVPALLTLDIPGYAHNPLVLIAWLIIVVQGSDVLQYVWGKLVGKHKVAPSLSPSKTWEGLVGGLLCASALGASLYRFTPFALWQAGAIALGICLMGFLGGLVMSAIKRDSNIKDWGNLIEGHGGMLDRLDSLIFAAPIYFHVTRYWWTP